MPKHDDVDDEIGVVRLSETEELQGTDKREIEKRGGHEPSARPRSFRRKSQVNGPDGFLTPTHYEFGIDALPGLIVVAAFDELELVV
ncbi:MAG: hypothetical protein ACLQPH_09715 [Acidimicrobiales bacterium]